MPEKTEGHTSGKAIYLTLYGTVFNLLQQYIEMIANSLRKRLNYTPSFLKKVGLRKNKRVSLIVPWANPRDPTSIT